MHTIRPPDLDDVIDVGISIAIEQGRGQRRPAAQRVGHLLQVVIKHLIRLLQSPPVGRHRLEHRRQQNGRHDRAEQAFAQGMRLRCVSHGFASWFCQYITQAAHGLDQLIAKLFAQAVHIHLNRVAAHLVFPTVEFFLKLCA